MRFRRNLIVATLASVLSAGLAVGAPRYVATPLGTLGGGFTWGAAINADGDVTGSSQLASGVWHPFVYSAGRLRDVDPEGGNGGVGFGINTRGQVTGCAARPDGSRYPFVLEDGLIVDMQAASGDSNLACGAAINEAGVVVGSRRYGTTEYLPPKGYWYANGSVSEINGSGVAAIGDDGRIAGTSFGPAHINAPPVGWTCIGADCATIMPPGSGRASRAMGVNARGQVTGSAETDPNFEYPIVYADGAVKVIGPGRGYGAAINGRGEVVGRAEFDIEWRPFLYTAGAIHDLNALVVSGLDGASLTEATAINESGTIVANSCVTAGYESLCKAFRLELLADPGVPIPTLSTWTLGALALALLGAGAIVTRRRLA